MVSHYCLKLQRNKQLGELNVRSVPPGPTGAPSAECDDGGAPASGCRRRVPKFGHKGCPGKHGADHFALRSDAAPVDDAQGAVAHPVRFDEVFFYDGAHVPRREGVHVEHIGDGNTDRFVVLCLHKPPCGAAILGCRRLSSRRLDALESASAGKIACPTPIFEEAQKRKTRPHERGRAGKTTQLPLLRAPDVKQPAETWTGSRSLPSDPSSGVSVSSAALPPIAPGRSGGEALPARPTCGRTPSAGWRGHDTPDLYPSDALSTLPVRSVPYWAIPPSEVAAPSRSIRKGSVGNLAFSLTTASLRLRPP